MEQEELFKRLDKIIELLQAITKQPTLPNRIFAGLTTGIGILGIVSIIEIIKGWIGG
jgi:hypothetical protein